jgi:hypothetical protein
VVFLGAVVGQRNVNPAGRHFGRNVKAEISSAKGNRQFTGRGAGFAGILSQGGRKGTPTTRKTKSCGGEQTDTMTGGNRGRQHLALTSLSALQTGRTRFSSVAPLRPSTTIPINFRQRKSFFEE